MEAENGYIWELVLELLMWKARDSKVFAIHGSFGLSKNQS